MVRVSGRHIIISVPSGWYSGPSGAIPVVDVGAVPHGPDVVRREHGHAI
jgi:hypothetical protein